MRNIEKLVVIRHDPHFCWIAERMPRPSVFSRGWGGVDRGWMLIVVVGDGGGGGVCSWRRRFRGRIG